MYENDDSHQVHTTHTLHSVNAFISFDCFKQHTHTHTHPFNGPLSRTTQVSRHQKGKTNLDFTEARDSGWHWHQLGHMQVWISIHTDNHASTPPLSFYRPDALSAAQPTLSKHWRQSRQLRQTKQKQNKCPLNSIFSRTTWVGQYQKGKTIVDFNEANWYGFEMAEARVGPHKNNLHLTPRV